MTRKSRHVATVVENAPAPNANRRGAESPRAAELTEAAAAVFAEKGYHGATTRDIADRLGIRQASLYYYIPSKEEALSQVCKRGVAGFVEQATAIAARPVSASEKVRELIREHLLRIHDRPAFVRVFLRERHHLGPASRRDVGALSRTYERIVQDIIESGVASREFGRELVPRLVTLAILGVCNAASSWYGIEPDADVEKIAATFHTLVIEGLVSDEGRRPATQPRRSEQRRQRSRRSR
jgi:AcrR family transcriptional regulator